jgi:hypothetical protein
MIRKGLCSLGYYNTRERNMIYYCTIGRKVTGHPGECKADGGNPHYCPYMPQDLLVQHESMKHDMSIMKNKIMEAVEDAYDR